MKRRGLMSIYSMKIGIRSSCRVFKSSFVTLSTVFCKYGTVSWRYCKVVCYTGKGPKATSSYEAVLRPCTKSHDGATLSASNGCIDSECARYRTSNRRTNWTRRRDLSVCRKMPKQNEVCNYHRRPTNKRST